MKVVVDIYGGDNAPNAIIDGCVLSLNSRKDFDIVMVGKVDEIKSYLATCAVDMTRIELVNADEVISCEESPTVAVRTKKNSSLVVALDITKNDDDVIGLVSAGSTGAVLTGATLKIGRIQGVARPALAPLLPTLNPTQKVLLIDCGANVDCKPNMLLQFGQMGSAYMKSVFGIASPKVGLLCNGTEEHKGNELTHEAFALLKSSRLNFVGNMEARDILSGNYDVVVADGFAGNVALKSCEGTAGLMMSLLKEKMTSSFVRKLAAAVLKPAFREVKNVMDYNKSGGAPFIGVEKLVIKSHGSSKAGAICGSIFQVLDMHKDNLIQNIKSNLIIEDGANVTN